jgi:quinoprotein glucose dehydrogenase
MFDWFNLILPIRLLGAGLLLAGIVMAAGDIRLSASLQEFFGDLLLLSVGALFLLRRGEALGLYALVTVIASLWSLLEVSVDGWQLWPRLVIWLVICLLLLPTNQALGRTLDARWRRRLRLAKSHV